MEQVVLCIGSIVVMYLVISAMEWVLEKFKKVIKK